MLEPMEVVAQLFSCRASLVVEIGHSPDGFEVVKSSNSTKLTDYPEIGRVLTQLGRQLSARRSTVLGSTVLVAPLSNDGDGDRLRLLVVYDPLGDDINLDEKRRDFELVAQLISRIVDLHLALAEVN